MKNQLKRLNYIISSLSKRRENKLAKEVYIVAYNIMKRKRIKKEQLTKDCIQLYRDIRNPFIDDDTKKLYKDQFNSKMTELIKLNDGYSIKKPNYISENDLITPNVEPSINNIEDQNIVHGEE